MNEQSRIRFNPVTKEIEIEGTETFVKTYFEKLQAMMSGFTKQKRTGSEIRPAQQGKTEAKKKSLPKEKAVKSVKSGSPVQKATHMGAVIELIQESAAGIATSALKEKTGLTELQIWNIVNRAAKAGKIRKIKRGLYGAV